MNDNVETPQGLDVSDAAKLVSKASNWQTYLIYLLLICILIEGIAILWQRGTVNAYKLKLAKYDNEITLLKTARDLAQSNEAACRVNFDVQNKKIIQLGKDLADANTSFDDLRNRILKGEFNKAADAVKNQPTPKTCQDAVEFINRNLP